MTSEDSVKAQLDALLAAYKEMKSEIARRSALSWAVVGGYLFFASTALKAVIDSYGTSKAVVWVIATWLTAVVARAFYARENIEILRLSNLIKDNLEERYRQLAQAGSNPLFLERSDPNKVWDQTGPSQTLAEVAAFVFVPASFTFIVCCRLPDHILECFAYSLAVVCGASLCWSLLKGHLK